MILFDTGTILSFGLLTASILSLWLPQRYAVANTVRIWTTLCALSVASGLYYGIVETGGVLYLLSLGAFCYPVNRKDFSIYLRVLCGVIVFGLAAGLFLHKIPFFNNPLVFDHFFLSEKSSVHTKYWSFDKAMAGLILLAYFGDICRSGQDWKMLARKTLIATSVTIFAALSCAQLLGYIKPDIKFSSAYFAWAWANLFFTCIPEEILFRGFLQKHLASIFRSNAYQIGMAAFIGIVFGLAHSGGSMTYAATACIAGIGYGIAYHITGKIESAILTHFLLNSVHFLFFTYPSTQ